MNRNLRRHPFTFHSLNRHRHTYRITITTATATTRTATATTTTATMPKAVWQQQLQQQQVQISEVHIHSHIQNEIVKRTLRQHLFRDILSHRQCQWQRKRHQPKHLTVTAATPAASEASDDDLMYHMSRVSVTVIVIVVAVAVSVVLMWLLVLSSRWRDFVFLFLFLSSSWRDRAQKMVGAAGRQDWEGNKRRRRLFTCVSERRAS